MDRAVDIVDAVNAARSRKRVLAITGNGTKRDWLPAPTEGELLSVDEHSGIEDYQPDELVITARAGTPLKEIHQTLARHEQMFAFEPPHFYGAGTLGGAVASGNSGPNRPWGGALRDAVLGVVMVNGRGERLTFGGQVMKNVAGYDVSRLQAGAYGTLGVLLSISLRVQPAWESQISVQIPTSAHEALQTMRDWARRPLPLTGTCWVDDVLYARLAGNAAAVQRAWTALGGQLDADTSIWEKVRDHQHPFFKAASRSPGAGSLWRVSTPPAAPLPQAPSGDLLVEWAGGLRWLWSDDPDRVQSYAVEVGGWAWQLGTTMPIDAKQRKVMSALKRAFDPDGLFASPLDLEDDAD